MRRDWFNLAQPLVISRRERRSYINKSPRGAPPTVSSEFNPRNLCNLWGIISARSPSTLHKHLDIRQNLISVGVGVYIFVMLGDFAVGINQE